MKLNWITRRRWDTEGNGQSTTCLAYFAVTQFNFMYKPAHVCLLLQTRRKRLQEKKVGSYVPLSTWSTFMRENTDWLRGAFLNPSWMPVKWPEVACRPPIHYTSNMCMSCMFTLYLLSILSPSIPLQCFPAPQGLSENGWFLKNLKGDAFLPCGTVM